MPFHPVIRGRMISSRPHPMLTPISLYVADSQEGLALLGQTSVDKATIQQVAEEAQSVFTTRRDGKRYGNRHCE